MDEIKMRIFAKQRLKAKKGFQIHFLVYGLVNLFLSVNNSRLDKKKQSPVFYIASIWGIGVLVQGLSTRKGNNMKNYEKRIEKMIHRIRKN